MNLECHTPFPLDYKSSKEQCLQVLFEIIQEGGDTFKGGLALSFYFNFKLDFGFADAANITDGVQFGYQSHATSRHNGLSESHLVHAIVHQHLNVVHLNNLLPQVR